MTGSRLRGWREAAVRTTAALAAAALGVVMLVAAGVGQADASSARFDGEVALHTDAAGSAMFTAAGLAPGRTVSNCIVVSYHGPATPVELRLNGASGGGHLDEHLTLRVEAGTGGGFGDCAGFRGTRRFEGSLATFVGDHGNDSAGLIVATLDPTDAATFRFSLTVQDDPAAQGRTSTSAYTWTATPTGPPTTEPPLTEEPEPPGGPGSQEPEPTEVPTQPLAPGRSPVAPVETPGGGSGDGGASDDSAGDDTTSTDGPSDHRRAPLPAVPSAGSDGAPPGAAVPEAAEEPGTSIWKDITRVLTFVAQRSSYLLLLLLVVLAFLAIQDRIDRKDPKLALAPREPDLDLHFEPPPTERTTR